MKKKILNVIITVFVICLFTILDCNYAEAFPVVQQYGDFTYILINNDTEIEIVRYSGQEEHVKIPSEINGKKVTCIGNGVFYGRLTSVYMKSIYIPSGITDISVGPESVTGCFSLCHNLEKIIVDKENRNYTSMDGVLFDKSKTKLIEYPGGKKDIKYVIPASVTSIEVDAFGNADNLRELVVPYTVNHIKQYAFSGLRDYSTLTIWNKNCKIDFLGLGTSNPWATTRVWIYGYKNSTIHEYAKGRNPETHKFFEIKRKNCSHTYKKIVEKATTKTNGYIAEKCTICGQVKNKETIIYAIEDVSLSQIRYVPAKKAIKPTVTVVDSMGNEISADNYKVTYKNNKVVGIATVKVTFKGNYTGTVTRKFKIVPKPTAITTVSSRVKGFTLKWKRKAAPISGYQIKYATNSRFKGAKAILIDSSKTTKATVSKLKANEIYYVRIRTYKTVNSNGKNVNIYSDWSETVNVLTNNL